MRTPGTVDRLEPEFAPAIRTYQTAPSPERAATVLKTISPVIDEGVRLYGGSHAGPLLQSHARRLAIEAIPSYDPSQSSLKTHLMNQFRRLQRLGPQLAQSISLPEGVALDRKHLLETERTLQDELGRDPSDREISNRTGLSFKRIQSIRSFRPPVGESEYGQRYRTPDGEDADDPAVVGGSSPHHALAEFLYDDLDPVDQVILEHSIGLRGAPRLAAREIAQRVNLSPGAVTQRAARIQTQLDRLTDAQLF
jgi:DNA-directed RNA polymerase sigma subunit (sigma70/sigma32)